MLLRNNWFVSSSRAPVVKQSDNYIDLFKSLLKKINNNYDNKRKKKEVQVILILYSYTAENITTERVLRGLHNVETNF